MDADEIRKLTDNNSEKLFLREIAAQLAEINQHLRSRQKKPSVVQKANSGRSMNRGTSHGKRFYVHHWQLQADPDMLRGFEPNEGQAALDDLEVNRSSIGALGTISDAKITRVQ